MDYDIQDLGYYCYYTAGTSGTTVIARYDTGSCFKLSGGIQAAGSYTWY